MIRKSFFENNNSRKAFMVCFFNLLHCNSSNTTVEIQLTESNSISWKGNSSILAVPLKKSWKKRLQLGTAPHQIPKEKLQELRIFAHNASQNASVFMPVLACFVFSWTRRLEVVSLLYIWSCLSKLFNFRATSHCTCIEVRGALSVFNFFFSPHAFTLQLLRPFL